MIMGERRKDFELVTRKLTLQYAVVQRNRHFNLGNLEWKSGRHDNFCKQNKTGVYDSAKLFLYNKKVRGSQ